MALLTAAHENGSLRIYLKDNTNYFIERLTDYLKAISSNLTHETAETISVGITGIYYNAESFRVIDDRTYLRDQSQKAVEFLLAQF